MASHNYQSAGLRRRQFARKVKWFIGVPVVLLVLIGIFYIVAFSDLFMVSHIDVVGAREDTERVLNVLRPQVLSGRVGGVLGPHNYFSWSDTLIYEDVRSNRVSVEKSLWGRRVVVTVHPRERYGVWCLVSSENVPACNWVDASGVVFEPAPTPEGQLIVTISEAATTTAAILGTPIINQDYFEVIKRVAESLPELRLAVSRIAVDRTLEELYLETFSGTVISFSLRFDPAASALPGLKKLIESPGLSGMKTVDFTVENRVFYTAK